MADMEQQPRRRIPWSYIFSFLVVIGIIVTVVILLFGGNSTTTLSEAEFKNALGNFVTKYGYERKTLVTQVDEPKDEEREIAYIEKQAIKLMFKENIKSSFIIKHIMKMWTPCSITKMAPMNVPH